MILVPMLILGILSLVCFISALRLMLEIADEKEQIRRNRKKP